MAGRSSTLSLVLAKGDGTIAAQDSYAVGAAGLALGDLNGDGLLDVVATKPDAVFVLFGACP